MHSRIKLVIISVFVALCSYGQNFDKNNHFLSDGENILPENFENSLDSLHISLSLSPDSLRVYKAWLLSDRKKFLAGNNEFYKVHYYMELARVHGALDEYETAYRSIDSALVAFDHNSFPGAYRKVINAAVAIAREYKDYHALVRYLEMLLQSGTIDHDSLSLGHVLLEMAQLHLGLHQYEESSEYACKALPVLQKNGDTKGMVDLLIVMYHDSFHINSDTTNMDYLFQAREIAFESGDSMAIANVYENIGLSYYRDGKQQNAIEYYKLARSYIPEKGSIPEVSIAIYQMLSSLLLEDADAAYELSLFVERQARKYNTFEYLSNAYRARATCFAHWNMTDSARIFLEKAHEERTKYSQKDKASPGFYYYLYSTALMINDFNAALKYLNISMAQQKRINREYAAEDLNKTRAEFDYELQNERISNLKMENELKRQSIVRQKMIIGFAGTILIILVIFLYLMRKQLRTLKDAYKNMVRKNLEIDSLNKSLTSCEGKAVSLSTRLNIKDEEKLYLKAKKLFEKDQIYKQQNLTAAVMAERLKTNTTYLSAIINKRFRQPFKSVVNKYRIDEARKIIVSEQYANYSIEGIAHEVGFQSRSVFYQVFRQETGMTPSAYIEAYRDVSGEFASAQLP